jgi:enamine deaminase RidA (YjgF/YER057c/UK114 family)
MAASQGVAGRLAAAGLDLPAGPAALGDYVPAVRTGSLVFTSGQLPMVSGTLLATGSVGAEVDADAACECAARCALNALAAASTVCDLDDVTRVVKVTGYVASAPGFTGQPGVVNGASAVMGTAFGEAGRHARAAVGVASLPLGAPVEVEIVLELA